ncbi:MAG: DNA repair protein RadA, partial [Granulosicoccaceae bacterium]
MAKSKLQYSCTACGAQSPKWSGQCSDCGEWNTLVESILPASKTVNPRFRSYDGGAGGDNGVITLAEVAPGQETRTSTGISELDRVLGGGLVQGSVVLI